ncbi:MAG: hypothetical protein V4472_23565 [Pseudomonadota bacterium]
MKRITILTTIALFAVCPILNAGPINGTFSAHGTIQPRSVRTYVLFCRGGADSFFEAKTNFDGMQVLVLSAEGRVIDNTWGPGGRCTLHWHSSNEERVYVLVFNRNDDAKDFRFIVRNGR